MYDLDDILSVRMEDNASVRPGKATIQTSVDNCDMWGRASFGNLLDGNDGKLIGAMTAKRNSVVTTRPSTVTHHYSLYVTVNNIVSPIIKVDLGTNRDFAREIEATFNVFLANK